MYGSENELVEGLCEVHAMEKQAEKMLSALVSQIGSCSKLKSKITSHLVETQEHAEQVESCIVRRGGAPPRLGDTAGRLMNMTREYYGMFEGGNAMNRALSRFENMEIETYAVLAATADELSDKETTRICRKILAEEEDMASWLRENLHLQWECQIAVEKKRMIWPKFELAFRM